jgi:hypothetical protein
MAANDEQVSDYGPSHGYAWGWFGEPLVVTFPAPRRLNRVEALLLDVDERRYDFRLEGLREGHWQELGDRRGAGGWVRLDFAAADYTALRLLFTGNTLTTDSYHVVEVAAYLADGSAGESPLRQAWIASQRDRPMGELRLLGVEEALQHVFLDPSALQRARALPDGERRWLDTDRDGDPDLIVFMDRSALVCVLDDDDDAHGRRPLPDEDNDCWVVDLDLDGRPDRVRDYLDDDGDGDVDCEHHYYLHHGWFGSRPGLVLIWDGDDDNRTWRLERYSYNQDLCQWDCDFGGTGGFSIFLYDPARRGWVGALECPFYFYDPDGDGLAEVALRLEGYDRTMRALRLSMNADDDATAGQPYDYDFSVTALGPVELPAAALVETPLRTGTTGAYLPHASALGVCRELPWGQTCLVWDENDSNVDPADGGRHERWEGVINARYPPFPQVGGPSCGTLNKRYELDEDGSGRQRLYASPVDGRLHLYGAERGTLWADDDEDGRPDRVVEYSDADGDGYLDTWTFDDDADGTPDLTVGPLSGADLSTPLPLEWAVVRTTYQPLLAAAVRGHESVAAALGVGLAQSPGALDLEARRWALERTVHQAFRRQTGAAQVAGDEGRAARLAVARARWARGAYALATAALEADDWLR